MSEELSNPIPFIQDAKHNGQLWYSNHALKRLLEGGRNTEDVEDALDHGQAQIVGHSPDPDTLVSPSCIVLGWDKNDKAVHVVVAYRQPQVITVYEPTPPRWTTPYER